MRILLLVFVLLILAPRALAADEEYLLGDVGVRMDLPKGWTPSRWSDADFRAEANDKSVALYVWSTPVQSWPTEAEIDLYGAAYADYLGKLGVTEIKKLEAGLGDRAGTPTVRGSWSFKVAAGSGRVITASFPVEGQIFHMACVAGAANARKADKACDELLERLEIRTPAPKIEPGGKVEKEGIGVTLPAGWRAPLPSEEAAVAGFASALPVQDLAPCSLAIRPRGPAEPDVMATCQAGVLLGIVDEYTFSDKEQELRPKLFGKAPVNPATQLTLADRTAFLYQAELQGRPMVVAVAPYDQGVARMYLLGTDPKDAESLAASAREAMLAATFSGDHPVSPDETIAYFATYRPTDPRVLGTCCGSTCCLLAAVGLVGVLVSRSRRKGDGYDDYA
jgi:hypothetical protein